MLFRNWFSKRQLILFLVFLLTPLIWPLFITVCLIFWFYRKLVDVTLRIKLGRKYGGMLDFSDAFSVFEDKSKCVIYTVLICNSDHEIDLLNYTKKCLQREVFDNPENYPKMSGTLHVYRGYAYFLKNSAKLDKCVKTFPPPENAPYDEEYVKSVAGNISNRPLPQGNTASWEFNFPEKPMVSKSNEGHTYRYPVVIRFHHLIGDGTSISEFLWRIYTQKNFKAYIEDIIFTGQNNKNSTEGASLTKSLKELLKHAFLTIQLIFYIVFLMFKKRIELIHWREKDVNALHGEAMSGETVMAWRAEDNVKFVPMVKRIKGHIPKTKFSHVVLTAFSAAITNYLKKQGDDIPNVISIFMTMLLKYPIIDKTKPVQLKNKTTAVLVELPVKGFNSLIQTLMKVTENSESITYFEAQTNLLFLHHVFALFPISIRTSFHDAGSYTAILSNLPGGSLTEIMDGCYIEKVIGFAPNVRNIGVSICISTYDNRFQIGLLLDKKLVSSQGEAQKIVDDIFNNFQLLDIETSSMFKSSS